MLIKMREEFRKMNEKVERMDRERQSNTGNGQSEQTEDEDADVESEEEQQDEEAATPLTLRQDICIMSRAAKKLAKLRLDDSDEDDNDVSQRGCNTGKKSGSVLTPTDSVRKQIDWPHMHLNASGAVRRKPATFKELRLDKFVYGFLEMIDTLECKWD